MYLRVGRHTCLAVSRNDPADTVAERGRLNHIGLASVERQSLPTDPQGVHTLTLNNVVVGSRVHIEDQGGTTTRYDQIAASATVVIPLQAYANGSPQNNWRIRVRKASTAPYYQPYETLMTATVGSSSIYVSQNPDE